MNTEDMRQHFEAAGSPRRLDSMTEPSVGSGDLLGRLEEARERCIESARQFDASLAALRRACTHELVAECDYQANTYIETFPPRRICETCGIEEEGWGSGWKILKINRVRNVSREQLYTLRRVMP